MRFALAILMACGLLLFFLKQTKRDGQTKSNRGSVSKTRNTPPLEWGIYQIYWGPDRFKRRLDHAVSVLSDRPDYVMFYRDLGRPYPQEGIEVIRSQGATPIISLELWRWHGKHVKYLPKINAGAFDDFFASWARDAKADGRRVLLRFGFEFNGDWFSWSLDPEGYVQAWRRARGIFEAQGADNVEWVWAPNVVGIPNTKENHMHRYFPGDEVVDWVGVDGYNWGDDHDAWHQWESCEDIFAAVVADFQQRYPNKPIMIAEFGSVEDGGGRKGEWIREAHDWLQGQSSVRAVVWFNFDKRSEGEHDWRILSSDASLAAFNETFARRH